MSFLMLSVGATHTLAFSSHHHGVVWEDVLLVNWKAVDSSKPCQETYDPNVIDKKFVSSHR